MLNNINNAHGQHIIDLNVLTPKFIYIIFITSIFTSNETAYKLNFANRYRLHYENYTFCEQNVELLNVKAYGRVPLCFKGITI